MSKSRPLQTLLLVTLVAMSTVLIAPPASAGGIFRTDGNDTPGPLDLASVRLTPINGGDRFQIKTLTKFTAKQLDLDHGWIEVDFDTNADRKINFWVVVFYYKGKLRAVQGQRSDAIRNLSVHRVDPRTVSFDIAHRNLGNVKSYDFLAASVWRAAPCSRKKPCVDTIPNRYPLIRHDFTPPSIKWKSVPFYSTDVSDTLTFPVSFVVKDDPNGSGVDHWTFQRRPTGGSWATLKKGSARTPTVQVTGEEGARYSFRVIAIDKQGNRSAKTSSRTAIPYDDRNVALVYSSGVQTTRTGAFVGTLTQLPTSETMTFTYSFSGSSSSGFCVIVGHPVTASTTATATMTIDGNLSATRNETDSTTDLSYDFCTNPGSGSHTIVISTTSVEPFVIDGVIATY